MKDDFEIIDLDNTTNLSLTQVNLEVEELEKELKRLQESGETPKAPKKAPGDVPKKVSGGAPKKTSSGAPKKAAPGTKKPVKKTDGKPVKKAAASTDKKSNGAPNKAASAAKPVPKKKQPLVTSKTISTGESWDDLHDISAKEAKKAIDSMSPEKSVYKTNKEAYAASDKNIADMLAEYDDISNTEKPKKLKKRPESGKRPVKAEKKSMAKPMKATEKPVKKVTQKPLEKPVKKSLSASLDDDFIEELDFDDIIPAKQAKKPVKKQVAEVKTAEKTVAQPAVAKKSVDKPVAEAVVEVPLVEEIVANPVEDLMDKPVEKMNNKPSKKHADKSEGKRSVKADKKPVKKQATDAKPVADAKAEHKPKREEPRREEPRREERPLAGKKPARQESEIQITPVASTGVRLGNKSGTSIGSVGGSYGLGQVGGAPKKSRYQMELERASREAQLVYESNRSSNRSAAAAINAKKEAEAVISFIDDDTDSSVSAGRTIDTEAKHAATAKGAPIMGGPRTAASMSSKSGSKEAGYTSNGKSGSGKSSSGSNKPKNNPRYTRDFDYEEPKENKIVVFFRDLTAMDYIIALTALFIVVAGVVVFNIFATSRNMKNQIAAFADMGSNLSNVGIAGESTLLAMADNRQFPEEEEFEYEEEEFEVTEYEENEDEDADSITVVLNMQSVVKDLKIKFVNKKSEKLIAGVPFEVEITDANGKTISKTDEDKDGIIYLNSMTPGDTTVKLIPLSGYDKYKLPTDGQKVTVKESPDYKKIDVKDEMKTEKQVNAAVEDTAQQAQVESTLTDTVEWVESTVKSVGDSTVYKPIGKDELDSVPNELKSAKATLLAPIVKKWNDLFCLKTYATTAEGDASTNPNSGNGQTDTGDASGGTSDVNGEGDGGSGEASGGETSTGGESSGDTAEKPKCEHPEGNYIEVVNSPAKCNQEGDKTIKCGLCDAIVKEHVAIPQDTNAHKYNSEYICEYCHAADPKKPASNSTNNTTKINMDTPLTYQGKQVYLDSNGSTPALYKHYKSYSKFYFKTTESTGTRYTGWQEIDGKTYFFTKDGNKVTGEQVIQGAKYNFDSEGALQQGSGNLGIDVSKWNGSVDWNKVKNSGISYVIIRCGYRGSTTGALIEDPKFKSNIKGATSAGLKVGIYFFSQATNEVEAIEEASMTLSLISGYKISYPIFLDVEPSGGRGDKIDSGTRTQVINAYCNTIRNSGYTPGVYANKSWLETKFSPGSINGKVWLAQYAAAPTYGGGYQMWQYSKSGKVSGISGNVDMNLSYLGY